MKYITRRILVTNEKSEQIEYTDSEFFLIDAPLILLGEPGAGKSELLRFASDKLTAKFYNASTVNSEPDFDKHASILIVDGIDEITAYESGTAVNKVLSKLPVSARFILSCRAADWQDAVNTSIINQKWHKQPVVGKIVPLNHQEIIDFINANDEGNKGEEFLEEAQKRDVLDLLSNPQNLLLFLKAIKSKGWPDTRLQLYENACLELVKEHNAFHGSINKSRPSLELLTDGAGFIFSQLLLSGESSISLDGHGNGECPTASELVSDDYDNHIIDSALSTNLFLQSKQNNLEPCHRTVAEFLSAKWIAKALHNQLSIRRLENIIYGSKYIVPSALRGLHAWIATLNPSLSSTFIERDPYGFFRYGDPSVLTISQSKSLLSSLEKLAEIDPYFRSEDWRATFVKGLARKELRDDIIRVIRNPKSPYQLSHLILESIQGDEFANDISNELLELVTNNSTTFLERHAALDVLNECNNQPDWHVTLENLHKRGDVESLRIALKVIEDHAELFSGKQIVHTLIQLESKIAGDDGMSYVELGYRLHEKLTQTQLEESLDMMAKSKIEDKKNHGHSNRGDINKWLYQFIQGYFERDFLPPADRLWSWLKNLNGQIHSSSWESWDKYNREYFLKNCEYRREIQEEILKSIEDADKLWVVISSMPHVSSGLFFREDDLIFHLDKLYKDRESCTDWDLRWKGLVQWGQVNRNFTGELMELARNQALQIEILSTHLTDLEKPPERDYEKENKKRERKYKRERLQKMQAIHQSYEEIQDELAEGKHLGALGDVAKAYLGRFSYLKETSSPSERIIEFVGSKIAPLAFQGLNAVMKRDDIPTPRQIIELHANEQKEYYFEHILLAHCAIILQSSESLSDVPIEIACSALAACHWDLHFGDDYTSELQKQLEDIVFADKSNKEVFVRDTMEPYLKCGSEHVSGLYRLARNEEFSDIAGSLAIEWIERYNISNNSLRELLTAAIRYGTEDKLIKLIREHVFKEKSKDEENRSIWMSAAFLLDFENNKVLLDYFAAEKKERLWSLRTMVYPDREINDNWTKLSAEQYHFLIKNFGPLWPPVEHPSDGWSGSNNPWDASDFLRGHISSLATDLSDQAEILLYSLVDSKNLEGYQNHIKHVYAQQTRGRAEANTELLSINDVRNILLKGEPTTHDDLQDLLIDELIALENRIRNSSTNDILPFWNGEKPQDENYCRDRIAFAINPYLERYDVRAHPEGTMPDNNRCDLLNTHGSKNLPIEIKGQWHKDVWTAASDQLQNYTREYHSDGRGIYLVLWFGYLGSNHSKNPHGCKGQRLPKTLDEMKSLIEIQYQNISEKTKIIVMDLSKSS